MGHPIRDGPVTLLKIVTPAAYWIQCEDCRGTCRTPLAIRHAPRHELFYPSKGAAVFVRDDDGFFYRGIVHGRRKSQSKMPLPISSWKYVVQLVDTLQVEDFDQEMVFSTNGASILSCECAHLVSLYNALPRPPPEDYGKSRALKNGERDFRAFESDVVNWDKKRNALEELYRNDLQFSYLKLKVIRGNQYGELHFSVDAQTWHSVLEFIAHQNIGVLVEPRFEEIVCALRANPLVDSSLLLPTFDPLTPHTQSHISTPVKKPVPLSECKSSPQENPFSRFQVYKDDVDLHRRLWKPYSVNIIYQGIPKDSEVVVRFITPDGGVVLGTVLNVDVKTSTTREVQFSNGMMARKPKFWQPDDYNCYNGSSNQNSTSMDRRIHTKSLIPQFSDSSDEDIDAPILSYCFDDSLRSFLDQGCIFQEPFLPYISSTSVEEKVVRLFESMNIRNLHEWQKVCLPSFLCRKNVLIIGSKSIAKLTTSTMFALSWIHSTIENDSVSPALIILISDFDRVDKIAHLCSKLIGLLDNKLKVLKSTSAIITGKQKLEAKSGCDVLITTPGNWLNLVDSKVFDYSRLSHVIFDDLDQLHELYRSDMATVFNELETSTRRIQTVLLTKTWGEYVRDYLEKLEPITTCVTDILLAVMCYKFELSVVFINDSLYKSLELVIFSKPGRKLLLCKDKEEGDFIVEQLGRLGHVVFIHENIPKEDHSKLSGDWESKLLVCTDEVFQQNPFVDDIDVLISWVTTCRSTLSSRFLAFKDVVRHKRRKASAYLICNCDKLDELLFVKSISKDIRSICGTLDDQISRAFKAGDYSKSASFCPSLLMFGECSLVPSCYFRHVFVPEDDPESAPLYFKLDILKVYSAFSFSVRVREIITNTSCTYRRPYALISNLKDIEASLERSSEKNITPERLSIGQVVGARICDKHQLRRVTVTNADGPYVSVSMLDYDEPNMRLPFSQLFVLPASVAEFPPDVVDLYIAGLMPSNLKSDWKYDTSQFISNAISLVNKSLFLGGKLEVLVSSRSVIVDNLFWCETDETTLSIVTQGSLKDIMLEIEYCLENRSHLPKLSEILVESGMPPLSLDLVGAFRKDLPQVPTRSLVSSLDHPGSFFVQLEEELSQLENFEKDLTEIMGGARQRLQLVAVNEFCTVIRGELWNRAVITKAYDQSDSGGLISILFVDHGDTLHVSPDKLYRLPERFTAVPFFALECELLGVLPLLETWTEEVIDKFASCIRDGKNNMFVEYYGDKYKMSKHSCKYQVILTEPDDPLGDSINFHLIRKGFARHDPKTPSHLLQKRVKLNGFMHP